AALRPARSCFQAWSTPTPNGDRSPMPVTTTRLIATALDLLAGSTARDASGRGLLDELDRVADGQDRLGGIVGNLDAEFFLERHHEFDRVEAVRTEIVDEARAFRHLVGIHTQMF